MAPNGICSETEYKLIPLVDIDISDLNVRRREITADLDELVASMKTYGLLQPISVVPKGDRFGIIIGQRRYLAAKHLGWHDIPALVLPKSLDATKAIILSFSENIQRRDLSARDKAEACSSLMNILGSVKGVARSLGISQQTVRKWLGYAGVPDTIKAFVRPKGLTVPQAIRIASTISDEETAVAVATRLADEPAKENRERVLDSASQLPGRSANAIFRRAKEQKVVRQIQFVLAESSARAMNDASQDKETPPNDLAKAATITWLEENRYLR